MPHKDLMALVEKSQLKPGRGIFKIGDTVDVHVKIVEGEKTRTQVYSGTVIARRGRGTGEAFTVRRLVGTEGVERVFPLHSPFIETIEVKKRGKVRRAKLYYLRDRVGKATRIAERRGAGVADGAELPPVEEAVKPRQATTAPKSEASGPSAEGQAKGAST